MQLTWTFWCVSVVKWSTKTAEQSHGHFGPSVAVRAIETTGRESDQKEQIRPQPGCRDILVRQSLHGQHILLEMFGL